MSMRLTKSEEGMRVTSSFLEVEEERRSGW